MSVFSNSAEVICVVLFVFQDRKMLSAAQQMLQDSRTKIELLRMQMVKINQVKGGELDGSHGTFAAPLECGRAECSPLTIALTHCLAIHTCI